MKTRSAVVQLAESLLGKNEKDGSYKMIIDIYNSYTGKLPRGIKMQYGWSWCACFWSALAIKLGYTSIMPIEISCGFLIEEAKKMGIWKENDGFVPQTGDAILYDWNDSGVGDNTGWPDHVGVVEYVNVDAGYFIVIEGNYKDSVKKRTMSINGKYIRGFITPKYDEEPMVFVPGIGTSKDIETVAREVIAGVWGTYPDRKKALERNGFNYDRVQEMVNTILNGDATESKQPIQDQSQPISKKVIATCSAKHFGQTKAGIYEVSANPTLYCRNDAGSNKKALCKIPKGTKVRCYGYYNRFNGVVWLYIQFVMDGVQYIGFSSSEYLKKL